MPKGVYGNRKQANPEKAAFNHERYERYKLWRNKTRLKKFENLTYAEKEKLREKWAVNKYLVNINKKGLTDIVIVHKENCKHLDAICLKLNELGYKVKVK